MIIVIETGKDFVEATQRKALRWEGCRRRARQKAALRMMFTRWSREVRAVAKRREEADMREKEPAALATDTLM